MSRHHRRPRPPTLPTRRPVTGPPAVAGQGDVAADESNDSNEDGLLTGATERMAKQMQALGMIEVKGLATLIEAGDAMVKSANVEVVGWQKIGSGYVSLMVVGDVAAVKAAVDAGAAAAGKVGEVLATQVIARPHGDLTKVLPGLVQTSPAPKAS